MGTPPPPPQQQLLAYMCRAATWSCRSWDSLLSLFRFLELCVIWTPRSEICLNRNKKGGGKRSLKHPRTEESTMMMMTRKAHRLLSVRAAVTLSISVWGK